MIPAKSAVIYTNSEYQLNIDQKASFNPEDFLILSNYPNPFNPQTTIEIQAPNNLAGTLNIFDVSGRLVRSFGEIGIKTGLNSYEWDGANGFGENVPTGVYIVSLKTELGMIDRKIVLLK